MAEGCVAGKKRKSTLEPVSEGSGPVKKSSGLGKKCCFSTCSKGVITESESSVEVKASIPKGKKAIMSNSVVTWSSNGEALFHEECWLDILKCARARNKKKTAAIGLTDVDKTMVKEANETAEYHDSTQRIVDSARRITQLIRNSKHCVVFTGAGISTSAGIGDYRGKDGKWTEMDRQRSLDDEEDEGVPYEQLRPTYTHDALTKLVKNGLVKHIITQNGDGLHSLAGIPDDKQSQLHGNVFLELCESCGHQYYRSYYVLDDTASQYYEELDENGSTDIIKPSHASQCHQCHLSHRTGRCCEQPGCRGYLKDSIINFGDDLNEEILRKAEHEATQSDLFISLGSTMQVTPACDLVTMGRRPLRLVIINRQKTGFDHYCTKKHGQEELGVRVYGDCDKIMEQIMKYI